MTWFAIRMLLRRFPRKGGPARVAKAAFERLYGTAPDKFRWVAAATALIAFAVWRWIEREDDVLPFLSVTALFFVLMSLDGSNVAYGDPTFY
jgi:hypothetical protein